MIDLTLVLAASLIFGDPQVPPPACSDSPFVRLAVIGWADREELIDARDQTWRFKDWHWADDVTELRTVNLDLLDAPAVCDRQRFPSLETAREAYAFNNEYRNFLLHQQTLHGDRCFQHYKALISEAGELSDIWWTIVCMQQDYYEPPQRRKLLLSLRKKLGDERYYRGQVPPPVPLDRFCEISSGK
jgi:hypothetical protein